MTQQDLIFTTFENSDVLAGCDEVAEDLMNHHFDANAGFTDTHEFTSTHYYTNQEDFDPITKRELFYVVSQQSKNKAPGFNEIDAFVVKNLCNSFTP